MANNQKVLKRIETALKQGGTRLDLSFKKLTSLPPEIAKLTNLSQLDLSGNQLTSLPPEITKLTNLISLDLYNNQLTSLPSER